MKNCSLCFLWSDSLFEVDAQFFQFGVDDGIDSGQEAVVAGEFLGRVEKSCRRDVENNAECVQKFCGDKRFAVFDAAEMGGGLLVGIPVGTMPPA